MRSDCAEVGGRTVCKEDKTGDRYCQPGAKCSCMADQFCSKKDTCVKPGKQTTNDIKKYNLLYTAPCTSNLDCESSPSKPVCKETVEGGVKVCQGPDTSVEECLPAQFVDSQGRCKDIKKTPGISHSILYRILASHTCSSLW